ncbi:hypothetical protein PAXRUDRAFT_778490, partial [Paxillus rubicundulus Ve08.2h10]
MVSCEVIEHICQLYIKPDHIVFNLLPAPLCTFMTKYSELRNWNTNSAFLKHWSSYLRFPAMSEFITPLSRNVRVHTSA